VTGSKPADVGDMTLVVEFPDDGVRARAASEGIPPDAVDQFEASVDAGTAASAVAVEMEAPVDAVPHGYGGGRGILTLEATGTAGTVKSGGNGGTAGTAGTDGCGT
jgi:hypothetical protein